MRVLNGIVAIWHLQSCPVKAKKRSVKGAAEVPSGGARGLVIHINTMNE